MGQLYVSRREELSRRGEPLACYEVPLLFEAGIEGALRPIVVVDAPVDLRVRRTVARDGGSPDEALARVKAQMPLDEKVRRADYVIDNAGSVDECRARADDVLDSICRELGVDLDRYPRT